MGVKIRWKHARRIPRQNHDCDASNSQKTGECVMKYSEKATGEEKVSQLWKIHNK